MKLFQYAVIFHGEKNEQGKQADKDCIVVPITTVMAADQAQASMMAARAIPEDYVDRMSQLEVAVRPF